MSLKELLKLDRNKLYALAVGPAKQMIADRLKYERLRAEARMYNISHDRINKLFAQAKAAAKRTMYPTISWFAELIDCEILKVQAMAVGITEEWLDEVFEKTSSTRVFKWFVHGEMGRLALSKTYPTL